MKKMASILLIVFFALAVIGRLSSFFDRVQYQGISQDSFYRSLQVEQKLTPEQLKEYGVLLDEQQQEQYDVYLICAEVENTTARNDYFYPDYDLCSIGGEYDYELLESSALMPASYGYSFYLPAGETVRCRFLILADKQAEDVEVRNDPSICAFFPA